MQGLAAANANAATPFTTAGAGRTGRYAVVRLLPIIRGQPAETCLDLGRCAKEQAMFLRNFWYVAAYDHEIGREPLGRMILGEPVVFFRKEDGAPVAF